MLTGNRVEYLHPTGRSQLPLNSQNTLEAETLIIFSFQPKEENEIKLIRLWKCTMLILLPAGLWSRFP